jgi:hypothetical protein
MRARMLLVTLFLLGAGQPGWAGTEPEPAAAAQTEDSGWDDWAEEDGAEESWDEDPAWTGFVELASGSRWDRDPAVGRRTTLAELRWRQERNWALGDGRLDFRADLLGDAFADKVDAELRELAYGFSRGKADFRVGRQVLTWGTGDLLFLNDLFPKGWVSFFAGRDDEYLKAPSDALRMTLYTDTINLDLAVLPRFRPDEYLTGERLSFFSPQANAVIAPEPLLSAHEPSASLGNTEWALRLFKNVNGNELALYAFDGFYHQPAPAGPAGALAFPRLRTLGASWRRTLGSGIFNLEASRHESRDDANGSNPAVPNGQLRLLAGYEWEAVANLTVALQLYLERTLDHEALLANSPWPQSEVAENRIWLTNRLSWRTRQDRVVWSLFSFYSATDHDAYLRPRVTWRASDAWQFTAGANLFTGDEPHTFFAQFEDNSNVYARIRYSY